MFDFLRRGAAGATTHVEADAVWLNRRAKVGGLRRRAEENAPTRCVLVLAQFPATLRLLGEELSGSACSVLEQEADTASFLGRRAGLGLAPAWSVLDQILGADADRDLDVLVAERHPLRSHDDRIAEAIGRLPGRPRLTFHLSLDDSPFLEMQKERIGTLLERLGMDEDEPIQAAMVAKAIARTQARVAQRATGDQPADSAVEWLQLNLG